MQPHDGDKEKILLFQIPIPITLTPFSGLPGTGVTVVLRNGEYASEHATEQKRNNSRMEFSHDETRTIDIRKDQKNEFRFKRNDYEDWNFEYIEIINCWDQVKSIMKVENHRGNREKRKIKYVFRRRSPLTIISVTVTEIESETVGCFQQTANASFSPPEHGVRSRVSAFNLKRKLIEKVKEQKLNLARKNIGFTLKIPEFLDINLIGEEHEDVRISTPLRVSHKEREIETGNNSSIYRNSTAAGRNIRRSRNLESSQAINGSNRKRIQSVRTFGVRPKYEFRNIEKNNSMELKFIVETGPFRRNLDGSLGTAISKQTPTEADKFCGNRESLKTKEVSFNRKNKTSLTILILVLRSLKSMPGSGKKNGKKMRSPEENQGNPITKHLSLENVVTQMSMENDASGGTEIDDAITMFNEEELLADVIGDELMEDLEGTINRASLNSPNVAIMESLSCPSGFAGESMSGELRLEAYGSQENSRNAADRNALSSGQGSVSEDENLYGSTQWYLKQKRMEDELQAMKRKLEEKDNVINKYRSGGAIPKTVSNQPNWNTEAPERRGRTPTEDQRVQEANERRASLNLELQRVSDLRNSMNEPRWNLDSEMENQIPFQSVNPRIGQGSLRYFEGNQESEKGRNVTMRQSGFNAPPYSTNARGRATERTSTRARNLIEGEQTLVLLPRGYPADPVTETKFKAIEQQLNKLSIHMDRQNQGHSVSVASISYKQGAIFVTVSNNATTEWLRKVADRTLLLDCHELANAPLRTAYQLWYPCEVTTFEECLALITRQNIQTDDWFLLKAYTNKPNTGQKFLFLGGDDLDDRIEDNGTILFQFRWKDRKGTIRRLAPLREARGFVTGEELRDKIQKYKLNSNFKEIDKSLLLTSEQPSSWMRSTERSRKCSSQPGRTKDGKHSDAEDLRIVTKAYGNTFSIKFRSSGTSYEIKCKNKEGKGSRRMSTFLKRSSNVVTHRSHETKFGINIENGTWSRRKSTYKRSNNEENLFQLRKNLIIKATREINNALCTKLKKSKTFFLINRAADTKAQAGNIEGSSEIHFNAMSKWGENSRAR